MPLSLPKTMSGSNDDDVRQRSAARRGERAVESAVGLVNLCPATKVFAAGCNSPCRQQEFDADERRRRDDVIEAFSTDRADQPLRVSVLPGRTRRRWSVPDPRGSKASRYGLAVASIAVTNGMGGRLIPWEGFCDLLRDPFCRRMVGEIRRRRSWRRMTNTDSSRKLIVGTTRKSMPPISATWLRKNVSTSGPALLADAWPCTWQPSTERSRPRASATRHEYEEHPIAGSLHSSAGSGCEPRPGSWWRPPHARDFHRQ